VEEVIPSFNETKPFGGIHPSGFFVHRSVRVSESLQQDIANCYVDLLNIDCM
jgi:hypothetical protein